MDLLYNQQQRALSKNSPSKFSWRAIASVYNNVTNRSVDGRTLYAEFTRKYDKNSSTFDKVVANFDEDGIELKAREEETAGKANSSNPQATVNRMAKRASSKLLKK